MSIEIWYVEIDVVRKSLCNFYVIFIDMSIEIWYVEIDVVRKSLYNFYVVFIEVI